MNLSKTANPFPDAHPADVSEVESGVMVNTLTEDAINAACLGFDLQRIKDNGLNGASNEHSAVLTLNIEAARDSDWLFSVASGSWKRICLNLVLNALKYTPCGYISVTLRKKWRQQRADREGSALVELVVSLRTNHLATGLANIYIRSKILALVCQKSSKLEVFFDHSSKRTAWPRAQDS
jgi:signal transduction histidine kinase